MSNESLWERMRKAADLGEAMEPSEEANLSWGELAGTLGVLPNEEGNLNGIDLFNACLNVQGNEAVQALPDADRVRVIRSAAAALDALRSGNLG